MQVCAKLTVQDTNVKIQVGTAVMALCSFLKLYFLGVNLAYACLKVRVSKSSIYLQVLLDLAATERSVRIGDFIDPRLMEYNQYPWGCQLFAGRQLILSGCIRYLSKN